ncbi:MAG: hypothetical protein AAF490_17970 [Chloroflexota bacterium]
MIVSAPRILKIVLVLMASLIFIVGCGEEPAPETDAEPTVEIALESAEEEPTPTAVSPTNTPDPTNTPNPTNTPSPTNTAVPTETPPPTETPLPTTEPTAVPRQTFYVSPSGSNEDGLSWETAWSELDQIDWAQIEPADLILLDGGDEQMVYETTLTPKASGEEGAPIRIQVAEENGRNGQVIIAGGRAYELPYCFQDDFVEVESDGLRDGILLENVSWLIIDGGKWRGIVIHEAEVHGIDFDPNTDHITLRNMEIYNNGFAKFEESWIPNGTGITLDGTNHQLQRLIIHDNGHDAIQSGGETLDSITISESWMYNSIPHPEVTEQSSNYCTHTDAFQIYGGEVVENINIEDSVLGPGFTNTIIFGDKVVNVNKVSFNNVLILKGAENNLSAHSTATLDVKEWSFNQVTVISNNSAFNAITFKGAEITIENSIFLGGHINIPNSEPIAANNCQWDTTGITIGEEINPQFVSAEAAPFSIEQYEPQAEACADKGSTIFSPEDLLARE